MSIADSSTSIAQSVAAVGRIGAVPSLLKILCQTTGMGFAAIARVTEGSWTACAVLDDIGFGLVPGSELEVSTTLCREVRDAMVPIAFNQASNHPVYCGHPTPGLYGFESYISVPIVLAGGGYFGNLCALDPKPAEVDNERVLGTFRHFAQLIAHELDNLDRIDAVTQELLDEKAGGALREQFVAVLGHDLRNPLGSIAACAALLKARHDDPHRVLDLADRIATSVRRLTGLIDDLFDFARGRMAGGFEVRSEPIGDLPTAINETIDELRAVYPERLIRTAIDLDRQVPGDRSRLQQLVSNLVANALTHGSSDAPVLVAAFTHAEDFFLTVHNEGDPIPQELLPSLFDAFSRHKAPNKQGTGLGLGLYICQQIVHAHGGTLEVKSTRTGGTVFTARLPTSRA